MAPNQYSFKRHEVKYMLDEAQYSQLAEVMEKYMVADCHGRSTICNIYYDTDDYYLIRRSLEKPVYKEKFRIRSYGRTDETGKIFIEIKKKYSGVVYKRRVQTGYDKLEDFLDGKMILTDNEQIQKELVWFYRFYNPKPKVFIGYEREAFYGANDSEFRVTFDRNIRFRTDNLTLSDDSGRKIIPDGTVLMEIKALNSVPMWMTECMSRMNVYPTSFSKYGTSYSKYIANDYWKCSQKIVSSQIVSPKIAVQN